MSAPTVSAEARLTLDWIASVPHLDIPVYQRQYRWSLEACRRLLDDVRAVGRADEGETHFIGSVLTTAGGMLVDGQQRITTVFLLLIALRDVGAVPNEVIGSLLRSPDGTPRLRTHPEHEALFARLVDGFSIDDVAPTAFTENVEEFRRLLAKDSADVWRGVQRLENIVVTLGEHSDAQQVFESLNSQGEALNNNELIHNYVLMGLTRDDQRRVERDIWQPIEQSVGRSMERFWRDLLVMTAPSLTDLRGQYGHYRHFRSQHPNLVAAQLAEVGPHWVRLAALYRDMRAPGSNGDTEIAAQLTALRDHFPASAPLVLGLAAAHDAGQIDRDRYLELLGSTQSMLVRRAVTGRDHDLALISELCRDLGDLYELGEEIASRTPDDDAIDVALRHHMLPIAPYVLQRIQDIPNLRGLRVEHIQPVDPGPEWDAGDGRSWTTLSPDEQGQYRLRTQVIGNLTLLDSTLGRRTTRRSFHEKQQGAYADSSTASAIEDVLTTPVWSTQEIDERTDRMIARFFEIWPRGEGEFSDDSGAYTRVVDLHVDADSEPLRFDHAIVGDEILAGVTDVPSLYRTLMSRLWAENGSSLRTFCDARGWDLIVDHRATRRQYVALDANTWLYEGWDDAGLLDALRQVVEEFAEADDVRVAVTGGGVSAG